MPKLPVVSGKKLLKCFLKKPRYIFVDQNGSHVILLDKEMNKKTTIPIHGNKDLPKGTLKAIRKRCI
jgi:predicted RNA binding protein YcfA (HicA-like mRNA interferase family)